MLCILLYQCKSSRISTIILLKKHCFSVYPQLSFLLLVFFVWQYTDSHQGSLPTLDDPRATDRSTVASSVAVSKPVSSKTTALSTTEKAAAETKHKVAEESNIGTSRSSPSQKSPENKDGSEKKLAELENLIKKLKSENDLTPALKDQLKAALKRREGLIASLYDEGAEDDKTTTKGLMHKLEDVESYLKKHHAQNKVTSGSEMKLSKVKAQHEVLKTKVANLQRRNMPVDKVKESGATTPVSKDDDNRNDTRSLPEQREKKLQRDERASIKEHSSKRAKSSEEPNKSANSVTADNSEALSVDCRKMKDKIKAIESYIMKYRKLATLSDEQKEKVVKAEKQRKEMKEKLESIARKMANVGSSGLSIEEKETIAKDT